MELMIQKGTRKIEITNGDNAPYDNGVRAYVTQGEFEKIYLGTSQEPYAAFYLQIQD